MLSVLFARRRSSRALLQGAILFQHARSHHTAFAYKLIAASAGADTTASRSPSVVRVSYHKILLGRSGRVTSPVVHPHPGATSQSSAKLPPLAAMRKQERRFMACTDRHTTRRGERTAARRKRASPPAGGLGGPSFVPALFTEVCLQSRMESQEWYRSVRKKSRWSLDGCADTMLPYLYRCALCMKKRPPVRVPVSAKKKPMVF